VVEIRRTAMKNKLMIVCVIIGILAIGRAIKPKKIAITEELRQGLMYCVHDVGLGGTSFNVQFATFKNNVMIRDAYDTCMQRYDKDFHILEFLAQY
jgi:hypothetical protein